jgi:DNA-binding transcriptional LysR family regulator
MDTSGLDLNLLQALEALLAERNVTRAAARLRLSQPALSARLARLRDLLGDPLLLPAQRGMTPTARALELEAPLRQALDSLRALVARQSRFHAATARLTVAVAASDYVQHSVLIDFVLALRPVAPRIRVALRTLDGATIGNQMAAGEIDLALMTAETAPRELRRRVLFEEHYVAIARRAHPKVRTPLTIEQFCALDHVLVSPRGGGFTGATDRLLAASGRSRNVVVSAAHFLFVPEIIARSDLVALVPARLVRGRTHDLQVFAPPIPVEGFQIAMLWHDRTHEHLGHRWLRDQLASSTAMSSAPRGPRARRGE